MALTGHDHIVIAVQTEFRRAAGFHRHDRGQCCPLRCLGFFAAKTATHTAHFHCHRIGRTAQHIGNIVLHFGWMLGRTMQQNIAVFLRNGQANLPFKVKVILPANFHARGSTVLGLRQGRCGIALFHHMWLGDKKLLFKGFIHRQNRWQFFVFDLGQFGGMAGLCAGFRRNTKNRLTIKLHHPIGQDRLVTGMCWRYIIHTGHIISGQNTHDTRCGTHLGQVHLGDFAMRDSCRAGCQMQRAERFDNVIDINRFARDMFWPAVML